VYCKRVRAGSIKKILRSQVTGQQTICRNSTRAFAFVIPTIDLLVPRVLVRHLLLITVAAFPGRQPFIVKRR